MTKKMIRSIVFFRALDLELEIRIVKKSFLDTFYSKAQKMFFQKKMF